MANPVPRVYDLEQDDADQDALADAPAALAMPARPANCQTVPGM